MTRRTAAVLLFAASVTLTGSSTEARMTPDVYRARHWLQQRMDDRHFACLHRLWSAESGWKVHSRYPVNAPLSRAAYGIPQLYPGTKMPPRARHDATRQVRIGLHYIRARYRGACAAWRHFQRRSYY